MISPPFLGLLLFMAISPLAADANSSCEFLVRHVTKEEGIATQAYLGDLRTSLETAKIPGHFPQILNFFGRIYHPAVIGLLSQIVPFYGNEPPSELATVLSVYQVLRLQEWQYLQSNRGQWNSKWGSLTSSELQEDLGPLNNLRTLFGTFTKPSPQNTIDREPIKLLVRKWLDHSGADDHADDFNSFIELKSIPPVLSDLAFTMEGFSISPHQAVHLAGDDRLLAAWNSYLADLKAAGELSFWLNQPPFLK